MTFSALDSELVGPLFATAEMREVFSDRARLSAMLQVEAALARVEAGRGLVPKALAPTIEAIDPESFDLAALGEATAVAGVPTIPFISAVRKRLPAELEPAFHKGATTQDILDTALVLQLARAFDLVARELDAILACLSRLAAAHRDTPCAARTYRQQAQPTSFGFKVAVWSAGIAEVAAELDPVRRRVLRASLFGPVGTLSGLKGHGPEVADGVAAELGLYAAPIAWHTRRAGIAGTGAWLATLIGALAKMATDVVDLASTEVGEVAEPHLPGRGGSSAMPHKRNPVSATVILSAHGAAPGFAAMLFTAMASEHERPAGAWHAEWHLLPSLFGLASGALAEARRLAEGLVPDPEQMLANLDATKGLLFADAVAAKLSSKLGGGAAHAKLEAAAAQVRATGRSLREVLVADSEISAALGPKELDDAFDIRPLVEAASPWVDRALAEVERVRQALGMASR
jgi:3-carboxy-cis,cis-muconate cycloisomerase